MPRIRIRIEILIALSLLFSSTARAAPSFVEYAKCAGILVVAAAMSKIDDPAKSKIYMRDAEALQTKASKLKQYNKETFAELSFDTEQDYLDMITKGRAQAGDLWADAGYCRGLAQ